MVKLLNEIGMWADFMISRIPGRTGRTARQIWVKKKLRRAGENITLGAGIEILGGENICFGSNISVMKYSSFYAQSGTIKIGSNVGINSNVCIGADGGEIVIGDDVLIGQNSVLRAADHEFSRTDIPIIKQGHVGGKIIIEDDCWLGANVVVTRGVTIGAHSVVAAGAVVTRDVGPCSVVGGVPARLIKRREPTP